MSNIILQTHKLTKEFKGFTAVSQVDLSVVSGSIHALIGPNGAGKTTCFNLLTKFLEPTSGTILFNGIDITRERPAQIARRGIIRSFQISAVFPHLTLMENVRIALQRDAHVLHQGQVREDSRDLEGADDAAARNLRRPLTRDVDAVEQDGARGRLQKLGQQVETGGLAGPVGPDQRVDGAAHHGQVHLADGREPLELLGELVRLQNDVAH